MRICWIITNNHQQNNSNENHTRAKEQPFRKFTVYNHLYHWLFAVIACKSLNRPGNLVDCISMQTEITQSCEQQRSTYSVGVRTRQSNRHRTLTVNLSVKQSPGNIFDVTLIRFSSQLEADDQCEQLSAKHNSPHNFIIKDRSELYLLF